MSATYLVTYSQAGITKTTQITAPDQGHALTVFYSQFAGASLVSISKTVTPIPTASQTAAAPVRPALKPATPVSVTRKR